MTPSLILQVAIPSPLHRTFDYLPPADGDCTSLKPGVRVRVPFGRGRSIGVVVGLGTSPRVEGHRLKAIDAILDDSPLLLTEDLALAAWVSQYYHHPLGEVIHTLLPGLLRQGKPAQLPGEFRYRLSPSAPEPGSADLRRAPRQAALLARLGAQPAGLTRSELAAHSDSDQWQPALRSLASKGWVLTETLPCLPTHQREPQSARLDLNTAQRDAVQMVAEALDRFQPFLLDGVTGSGKTEVYLQLIEQVTTAGRQALILVPEIGLTPQLLNRFTRRLDGPIAVLHSGLGDRERLCAWLAAARGEAPVVIGTRSAAMTPLNRPGLIIVDEEHDPSFKQQDGLRYSARDVAVVRAQRAEVPVVLGSATPSLETLYNVRQGRYRHLRLPERAGAAAPPRIELLDIRGQPMEEGISRPLLTAMSQHLEQGGQVLLFLNRRGYAPTLICHDCGWVAECRRCDAHMTFHQAQGRLRCHHCGTERRVDPQCPGCGSPDLRALGQGTERIETALQQRFPEIPVLRIDRDSTRRKGAMEELVAQVRRNEPMILVGTQMLAKGHHFPAVTLVGVVDGDQGLFGVDFRSAERMAQLIVQVAGRAGRAERRGRVLIQTHHPDHPLLRLLIDGGYHAFAEAALAERREAAFPPYSHMALLRAEATDRDAPLAFLQEARGLAEPLAQGKVALWGPVAAPMERRAGRFRAQLLLQAAQRPDLHRLLGEWIVSLDGLKSARRVRWSLDVDPVDLL